VIHPRSFAARYLTLFAGEAFSKLCVMAAFAYLAHTLSPADYGVIELALSITVFFVLGVESGMGLYGARIVAAAPDRIPRLVPQVMVLRAALGVPAFLLIAGLAAAYRSAGLGILAVNGLAILLTPFLTQWVFQGLRQMQWVAAGTALRNFTFVAVVVAVVRPDSDIRLVALAEVCGLGVLALANAVFLRRLNVRLDWRDVWSGTGQLFRDVWFMGLSDFTWACLWYSPALVLGWMGLSHTEQVAWVGSAVRIVLALHTFVFLYFFNLLPNLATELAAGLEGWRDLVRRSVRSSMWPAGLIAVGGTLIAPILIPAIYSAPYVAAVLPFQIAVWMIPLTWLSGHFRFSLIAAGQQKWEFAVSTATAVATVGFGLVLGRRFGSSGAAAALVAGGVVNTVLSAVASRRFIGAVSVGGSLWQVCAAIVLGLAVGAVTHAYFGAIAGAAASSLVYGAIALRQSNELVALVKRVAG
jgi:O-antigen/teichoic acid export membrane protein